MKPAMLLILISVFLSQACTFTAPDGVRELSLDIEKDQVKTASPSILEGNPVFIKVMTHPRIEGSNLVGRHWMLLSLGRKRLDTRALSRSLDLKKGATDASAP